MIPAPKNTARVGPLSSIRAVGPESASVKNHFNQVAPAELSSTTLLRINERKFHDRARLAHVFRVKMRIFFRLAIVWSGAEPCRARVARAGAAEAAFCMTDNHAKPVSILRFKGGQK